jgi:hypothetical protein
LTEQKASETASNSSNENNTKTRKTFQNISSNFLRYPS